MTRYFEHFPGPQYHLLAPGIKQASGLPTQEQQGQQQPGQQLPDHEQAFAALLGLQLLPELRKTWGAGPFLDLLLSEDVAVRWAAVQALGILLNLVGLFVLCMCV